MIKSLSLSLSLMPTFRAVLFIMVLILSGCSILIPHDYDPAAPIEYRYSQTGPYGVTRIELSGQDSQARYAVYLPDGEKRPRPMVILQNGNGARINHYDAIARHLASWGLVVLGSNDKKMGTGAAAIASLREVAEWTDTPGHPLHGRIDMDRIALIGTSQGAAGTINAQTNFTEGRNVRAIVIHATPSRRIVDTFGGNLDLDYDVSAITAPVLVLTGTTDYVVSPVRASQSIFNRLQGTQLRVLAAAKGGAHLEFIRDGGRLRGYLTAWLTYHLSDDPVAQQAFIGTAEITTNPNWSFVRVAP